MVKTEDFPTTNAQFASFIDTKVREIIGGNLIIGDPPSRNKKLSLFIDNEVQFNVTIKKDSLTEDVVEDKIKEYLATKGISCELSNKNNPAWNIFYLLKEGKRLGTLNVDVFTGKKGDSLFITISKLKFE